MLITIKEAAKILGVSESTLRNWDKNGNLKALRTPGNVRRYDKDKLQEFIKNKMEGSNNDRNL